MASSRSRSAAWETTAELSWRALYWASSSRPPTSWLAAFSPRWRYSSPSFLSCWHVPRASPTSHSDGASDGHVLYRDSSRACVVLEFCRGQQRPALGDHHGHHADAAAVRGRLLGRDRDARLHLLGACR